MLTLAPATECSTPKPSFSPNPVPFILPLIALAHAHHHTHNRRARNDSSKTQPSLPRKRAYILSSDSGSD